MRQASTYKQLNLRWNKLMWAGEEIRNFSPILFTLPKLGEICLYYFLLIAHTGEKQLVTFLLPYFCHDPQEAKNKKMPCPLILLVTFILPSSGCSLVLWRYCGLRCLIWKEQLSYSSSSHMENVLSPFSDFNTGTFRLNKKSSHINKIIYPIVIPELCPS